jgi:hypothetical protein
MDSPQLQAKTLLLNHGFVPCGYSYPQRDILSNKEEFDIAEEDTDLLLVNFQTQTVIGLRPDGQTVLHGNLSETLETQLDALYLKNLEEGEGPQKAGQ